MKFKKRKRDPLPLFEYPKEHSIGGAGIFLAISAQSGYNRKHETEIKQTKETSWLKGKRFCF